MKKNVIVFGLIAGLIVSTMMVGSSLSCYNNPGYEGNMIIGYAGMIAAFSFIFVGVKNFRDKYNGGVITFGKAFKTGLYISLIASTMYVGVWLFEFYVFIPDFMTHYTSHVIMAAKNEGATQAELDAKVAEMAQYNDWYKSPVLVILLTYMEVLPIGIVIALITALILKRKRLSHAEA